MLTRVLSRSDIRQVLAAGGRSWVLRVWVLSVWALSVWVFAPAASAQLAFVDSTDRLGLGDYRAGSGDGHGPGAVFTDLDDDGYPELYLVRHAGEANELYRNVPDGAGGRRFERAIDDGGAGDLGAATGAVAGDYDNDGDLDLYVLNFDQPNVLYRNLSSETGDLAFVDVTAGTDPTPGPADDQLGLANATYEGVDLDNSLTAAWADPNRDGLLDLYVGNHNSFYDADDPPEGPFDVPGRRDIFYRNNGDGTFTDATMALGVTGFETESGDGSTPNQRFSSTNAVQFADLDNDDWPDLVVTNKVGGPDDRDMIYRNLGVSPSGRWRGFRMITYELDPTFGHRTGGAMGIDIADPDRDGDLDLYFSDWSDLEDPDDPGGNDYWVNQLVETGGLGFAHSDAMPAQYSWGTRFEDFDNDAWLDLYVGVESSAPDRLYHNSGGNMRDEAPGAGTDQTGNARGVATADYDLDGWVDVFVVRPFYSEPSILYENLSGGLHPDRRFLTLRLEGDPRLPGRFRSTRDAIGARVTVEGDFDASGSVDADERLLREVTSGSSNSASTSSLNLEFGVGLATVVRVRIEWPSGRVTTHSNVPVDRRRIIRER